MENFKLVLEIYRDEKIGETRKGCLLIYTPSNKHRMNCGNGELSGIHPGKMYHLSGESRKVKGVH